MQTQEEMKRNNIAWSGAERSIKANNADVFVIFDCCYAGGFGGYEFRAAGHTAFQCLAACGSDELTRRPGEDSFTSALIWALEELQSRHPFTSKALLDKIREYDKLPKSQNPKLLRRDEHNDEIVWIAPQSLDNDEPLSTKSEHRDLKHEYLDLRFKFFRNIVKSDAEVFARHMSKLVHDVHDFQARHIIVLDKTSTHSRAVRNLTSSVHQKRKHSVSSNASPRLLLESEVASPVAIEPDIGPLSHLRELSAESLERRLLADLRTQPQSALYHLRMALHYMLQSIKSVIEGIADRVNICHHDII
jgi:hypothetical protein